MLFSFCFFPVVSKTTFDRDCYRYAVDDERDVEPFVDFTFDVVVLGFVILSSKSIVGHEEWFDSEVAFGGAIGEIVIEITQCRVGCKRRVCLRLM